LPQFVMLRGFAVPLELALSPTGALLLTHSDSPESALAEGSAAGMEKAFALSPAAGLEHLAGPLLHEPLPPSFSFWREFARLFFTRLCHTAGVESGTAVVQPSIAEFTGLIESAPPMKGAEYLTSEVLQRLWTELESHVRYKINASGGLQAYLQQLNAAWNSVGRVTFHLAENKRNPQYPFAFLATYTNRISEQGKAQHLPLGRALQEYAGAQNRAALTSLLQPVQRATEKSKLARELLESRAIFQPQLWRPEQAYRFLKEIPFLEESGVTIRIPDWWRSGRPSRPQVTIKIGDKSEGILGKESLLDFELQTTLDGEPLSEAELKALLNSSEGLVFLKGKWVEVDREKLTQVLEHWKKVQSEEGSGVSFLEGLRMLSGFDPNRANDPVAEEQRAEWSTVIAGRGLQEILDQLTHPEVSAESDPGKELKGELRPYQRQGVHWLWFMTRLGLGACLADDMGLGKTIQIIALLLALKRQRGKQSEAHPSLLVVPASLIANWKAELQKFGPSLNVFFAHASESSAEKMASLAANPEKQLQQIDLVITTYGLLSRLG
jgi:hypothetical protein